MVPFIFGLPNSHFDLALLWEPAKAVKRRTIKPRVGENHDEQFPSWSWCGWIGTNVQKHDSAKMLYNPDMVDGCMSNVREWLTNHTWICWYIRDGHGNVRPLWDATRAEEDQSTETRWKGYKGCNPSYLERRSRSMALVEDETPFYREASPEIERVERALPLPRSPRPPRDVEYRYDYVKPRRRSPCREADFEEERRERNNVAMTRYFVQDRPESCDAFGRAIRSDIQGKNQDQFCLTLPENPFRVLAAEGGYRAEPDKEFPDQPVLQFWTWKTSLHVVPSSSGNEKKNKGGLCRCDIADEVGDWCGSIVVDEDWIRKQHGRDPIFEFIAVSEARSFTEEECPVWTYYIPKERDESTWDLFFVLLVRYYPEKGVYERVALGKVFKAAFTLSNDEWREILLG